MIQQITLPHLITATLQGQQKEDKPGMLQAPAQDRRLFLLALHLALER